MRWFWNALIILLFLLVFSLGVLAMVDNTETVALRLLQWETPALSVYWWLVAALIIGIGFGRLFSLRRAVVLRLRARRLERELERSRRELARLREAPASDGAEQR